MDLDSSSRRAPETVGDYRVVDRLGSGGMGEVYRAVDDHLDRSVAIKLIRADLTADPAAQERFRREAQAIAKLDHPSIVRIHHVQKWEGHQCIVMELVEGKSLDALLRGSAPMPSDRAVRFLHQVAEGLAAAHAQDIVHRDLKTSNVMVTPSGDVKILDFGLAKRLSGDTVSAPGAVVGTLHTMSPEQAQGRPVDTRTDLFSLGALAYELLTGVAPFRGDHAGETLARVIGHRPPPVDELAPGIPEELSALVDQLLEKDPDRRPSSARHVADVLAPYAEARSGRTAVRKGDESLDTTWAEGAASTDRSADDTLAGAPTVAPTVASTFDGTTEAGRSRLRLLGLGLSSLVVAGLLYVLGPGSALPDPATALVLGFAAEDGTTDEAWISELLTEQMTEELRGHREIRVLGADEAFQLRRDLGIDAEAVRKEPETVLAKVPPGLADLVVVGTWRGTFDDLEARATIRNTRTDRIDGESLEGPASSPLLAARGLASALVNRLGIRPFTPEETGTFTSIWPTDPEGLRAFVGGLTARRNAELSEAERSFELALERVPSNPLVLIEQSLFLADRYFQSRAEEVAKRAVEHAEALDSDAGTRVIASAQDVLFNPAEAARSYRRLYGEHPDEFLFGLRLAHYQETQEAQKTFRHLRSDSDDVVRGHVDLTEAGKLVDSRRYEEALPLAKNAVSIGRELGHASLQAMGRQVEGTALDELGRYPEALESFRQSQILFEQTGDYSNAVVSLISRSIVLGKQGRNQEALGLFTKFHQTFSNRGDEINAALIEVNRASALLGLGRLEDAEEALGHAVETFIRLDARDMSADALANLAIVHQLRGDLERARATNEQALEMYRELDLTENMAAVLGNLGEVLQWSGDLVGAEARYEEALDIHRQGGNQRNEQFLLGRLGEIAILEGRLDVAVERLRAALQIGEQLDGDGHHELTTESRLSLARAELEAENLGSAQGLAREAVKQFLEAGSKAPADRARLLLIRILLLGKTPDWAEVEELESLLDPTHSLDYRLTFGVPLVRAEIEARRDPSKLEAARRAVLDLADRSERAGRDLDAWESRLLLGELEMDLGDPTAGKKRLERVRDEAHERGWALFERRAANRLDR